MSGAREGTGTVQARALRWSDGGRVPLPSGTWRWTAEPRARGHLLVFRHTDRPFDEMRNWSYETVPTGALITSLAVDPAVRLWKDPWGMVWECSHELDLPDFNPTSDERDARARRRRLRFKRGLVQYWTLVPPGTRLGELAHEELTRYITQAGRKR